MTENILAEAKTREVELADGKVYKLSPLNLNVMAKLEDSFECGLDKLMQEFEKKQASSFRKMLFILLQDNHPEITLEDVGKLVPMSKFAEISKIISEVMTETE